jgi:hypothetical protein
VEYQLLQCRWVIGYFANYLFIAVGFTVGIVALVLKIRRHDVRQFGVVIVSLVVSCVSVAQIAYIEWAMWQWRPHVS